MGSKQRLAQVSEALAKITRFARFLPFLAISVVPAAVLAALVLPFVRWGFSDDDNFIDFYVQGKSPPMPISATDGRFWPFGHQEWRLLPHMTEAFSYHLVASLQFAAVCILSALFLSTLSSQFLDGREKSERILLASFIAVTTPPVLISFANIVVPERNQILLIIIFLVCVQRAAVSKHKYILLAVACVSMNASLYFKEPTVLFYFGYLAAELGFRTMPLGLPNRPLNGADRLFLVSCLASIALYFRLYVYFIPLFDRICENKLYHYAQPGVGRIPQQIIWYFMNEPILWAYAVLLYSVFLWTMIAGKWEPKLQMMIRSTFPIFLGGALYFLFICATGLGSRYYQAVSFYSFSIVISAFVLVIDRKKVATVLVVGLVFLQTSLAVPSLIYKYDWTNRNYRIVQMIRSMESQNLTFDIRGNWWDVFSLVNYARQIEGLQAVLYCDQTYRHETLDGRPLCSAKPAEVIPDVVVELSDVVVVPPSIDYRREARFLRDGKVIWQSGSVWYDRIPDEIRSLLQSQYRFW